MGYCNIIHIERVLAQALTSAPPNQPSTGRVNLLEIGNQIDGNLITDDLIYQYIQWSDSDINASISSMYVTPISPKANYEVRMFADIDEHNSYIILPKPDLFNVGDDIVLTNGVQEELHYITEITDGTILETYDTILYDFQASNTRVLRVAYPYPITQCSARSAAANIYDKYFSSQSDPNVSDFGKYLRKQSRQDIDDILNGRTILHGVHRINRFFNANLSNGLGWPAGPSQATQNRDIDDIG